MTETTVDLAQIHINGRHRKDLGDVESLARSIARVGLLNPVTVTSDMRLVAGHRRVEAFRSLGRDQIPVRVVATLDEASLALEAERDENVCRKAMLPSELAALGEALMEIESEAARQRQSVAGKENGRGIACDTGATSYENGGKSRDKVGRALGMSGTTYGALRGAYKISHDEDAPADERRIAQSALAKMDAGAGVRTTAEDMRRKIKARREAQQAKDDVIAETAGDPHPNSVWIPAPNDKTREAVARRRELIREMAEQACTSSQIAGRLGITVSGLKAIAKNEGIDIPADAVVRRGRQTIDSNRVVREIVNSLVGLDMSLDLVNYDALDRTEIQDWTKSLTESIRLLNRLNKNLKELAQ